MSLPTKLEQTPVSWIRASLGRGRIVVLIDSALLVDNETAKLRDLLIGADQAKQHWVFAFAHPFLDYDSATKIFTITLPSPETVRKFASDSYDDAEEQYDEWSLEDTGKRVARGLAGLQMIGKEE